MMPYMCDSLLPAEERFASMKYRRLSRWFDPYKQLPDELIELRAMLLTPGLLRPHVFALMNWNRGMAPYLKVLDQLDDQALPLAQENAKGVDEADGEAMLKTILGNFPNWSRSVPLWSTRYLQARRRRGASVAVLVDEFRTTPARLKRWWLADMFDPLTGLPRPAGSVARSRPARAARFRPTA